MNQQVITLPGGTYLILTLGEGGTYNTPSEIVWDSRSGDPCPADVLAKAEADMAAADISQAWAKVRSRRDELLTSCDWTQLGDTPLESAAKIAWETYRQALRDLPANTIDPSQVLWPTPPGGA